MLRFRIHPDAADDLRDLRVRNRYAAQRLVVLFQELEGDQGLLERLLDDHFGEDGNGQFDIRRWVTQWEQGRDLWRLKDFTVLELGANYRVVYAYLMNSREIHVLGIVHRSFEYDEHSEIGQRILAAYHRLLE